MHALQNARFIMDSYHRNISDSRCNGESFLSYLLNRQEEESLKTGIYWDEDLGRFLPDCVVVIRGAVYWQNTRAGENQRFKTGFQLYNQRIKLEGVEYFLTPQKVLSIVTFYDFLYQSNRVKAFQNESLVYDLGECPPSWVPYIINLKDLAPIGSARITSKKKGSWKCCHVFDLCDNFRRKLGREHAKTSDLQTWREGGVIASFGAAPFTLDEFFSRFYNYKKGTQERRKERLARKLVAFLKDDEPRLRIGKLTPEHCKAFLRMHAKHYGRGLGVLKTYKGYISAMFNEGVRKGVITLNPMKKVNPRKMLLELEEEAKAQAWV